LKGAGGKGLATIPADRRQSVTDLLEGAQCRLKVMVLLNQDWDSALNRFGHYFASTL